MTNLFEHTDPDGDVFWVAPCTGDPERVLSMGVITDGSSFANLGHEAVRDLHAVLGRWLGAPEPVYPADSLYGQLIRKAVAAEVARVLPLHLAPFPRCRRCGVSANEVHTDCAGDARACQYILPGAPGYDFLADPEPFVPFTSCTCHDADGNSVLADPEPHDVGHPTLEDARPHPVNTDPAPGLLGATLPVGTSHCPDCDHGWNDHTVGVCWGSETCFCPAERPAPVPVTESDKVWGEQGAPPIACTCEPHSDWGGHDRDGCTRPGCACLWTGAS